MKVQKLYRPVGLNELALIWDSGMKVFPPRLSHQPIFYPVLSFEYAEKIARDWNTSDEASGFCGYVTSFDIDDAFLAKYQIQTAGSSDHQEYWIPASELEDFNHAIQNPIVVEAAFFGEKFRGWIASIGNFSNKTAIEQFILITKQWGYSRMDVGCELLVNAKTVYLNCLFWKKHNFAEWDISEEEKKEMMKEVYRIWAFDFSRPALSALSTKMPDLVYNLGFAFNFRSTH